MSSKKQQNFQYFKTTLLDKKENIKPTTNCDSDVSLSSSMELDESFQTYLKNNVSNEIKEKFFNNTNKYNFVDKSPSVAFPSPSLSTKGESINNIINTTTTTTASNNESSMKTCIDFTLRTNCTNNSGDKNSIISDNDTTSSKYLTSDSISNNDYEEDSLSSNKNILQYESKRNNYDDDSLEVNKSYRLSIVKKNNQSLSIDEKIVCKEESVILINSSDSSNDSCYDDDDDDDDGGDVNRSSINDGDIKYISKTNADEIHHIKKDIPLDGNLSIISKDAAVAVVPTTIKSEYDDDLNRTTSIDGKISNKSYGSSSYQTATMGIESGDSSSVISSLRSENFNSDSLQSSIDNYYSNVKNSSTTTTDTSLNSNENHYSVNSSSKSSSPPPQLLMHNKSPHRHQLNKHILNDTQSIETSSNDNSLMNEKSNFSMPSVSRMNNNDYYNNNNSNESTSNDDFEERKFNDTLEEVEFLIEQGMKMKAMAETNNNNNNNNNMMMMIDSMHTPINIKKNRINIRTPESQNKTPKTPNTVIAVKSKPTAPFSVRSPMQYDQFKKPAIINHNQQQQQPTRIPKRVPPNYPQQQQHHHYQQHLIPSINNNNNNNNNKRFEHIVSPISQYIKSGQSPLIKTIPNNTEKNFFDSTLCQRLDYSLRQSSMAPADGDESGPGIHNDELPRKAFISTDHCQMVDNRKMIVPGGASVQRLIGDVPYAIKHTGRVHLQYDDNDVNDQQKKYDGQAGVYKNYGSPSKTKYDSSFADLSIMPGDLSIQVVKNVQRL